MMQMLAASGLPLLTDRERKPDVDNPHGYCEWEPIKLLPGPIASTKLKEWP